MWAQKSLVWDRETIWDDRNGPLLYSALTTVLRHRPLSFFLLKSFSIIDDPVGAYKTNMAEVASEVIMLAYLNRDFLMSGGEIERVKLTQL